MRERYWYQDGGTVLGIVFVAVVIGFFGYASHERAQHEALPDVVPKITGHLSQPLFGSPTLEITVWHQHTAALRNVVLFVNVNEDPDHDEKQWDKREHSFETWQPNKDQAVKFTFPLRRFDPQKEIRVGFVLAGKTIKPYFGSGDWIGKGWKSEE